MSESYQSHVRLHGMDAAQPAHAADRLIEGLIVAGVVYAWFRFMSGVIAQPGGG